MKRARKIPAKPDVAHEEDAHRYIEKCGGGMLKEYYEIPSGRGNCDFVIPEHSILLEYKRVEVERLIKDLQKVNSKEWDDERQYNRALENVYRDAFRGRVGDAAKQLKATRQWIGDAESGRDWFSVLMITNSEKSGDSKMAYQVIRQMMRVLLINRKKAGARNTTIDAVLFTSFEGDTTVIIDDGFGPPIKASPFQLYHRDERVSEHRRSQCYEVLRMGYRAYLEEKVGVAPTSITTQFMRPERVSCSKDYDREALESEPSVLIFPHKEDIPAILFTSPAILATRGDDLKKIMRQPMTGSLIFIDKKEGLIDPEEGSN